MRFLLFFFIFLLPGYAFSEEVLTWEAAVAETALHNTELQTAIHNLRSSTYQKKGARSTFFPQVSGALNYNYNDIATTQPSGATTSSDGSSYSASVNATENVFAGFGDVATIRQRAAEEKRARATLTAVKAKVSFDLHATFAGLLYAQKTLRLATDIFHRREENLNLLELRYENGKENKGSLLLSRAYLNQAQYEELLAKNNVKVAQADLAKVLGRDNAESLRITGSVPLSPPPVEPNLPLLATTTPEFRQAEAQKEGAKAAVKKAESAFYPRLDLSGSYGRSGDDWPLQTERWFGGVTLSIPFFNGGRDFYGAKSAAAEFQAAAATQETVRRETRTQLEIAYTTYLESVAKLLADESFAEASLVRATIARERYNNGLLTFEDWDIIENELISRQKQVLQSERDRIVTEAAWKQAQGKGVLP